jgi:hypothetical protein
METNTGAIEIKLAIEQEKLDKAMDVITSVELAGFNAADVITNANLLSLRDVLIKLTNAEEIDFVIAMRQRLSTVIDLLLDAGLIDDDAEEGGV